KELLLDRLSGFLVLRQAFKFDLNAYLAVHLSAPIHSLQEGIASGTAHPPVEKRLEGPQDLGSRRTKEKPGQSLKRSTLRHARLKAMADNHVDALAYPTIRRKANLIGETQLGTNCLLSSNSGLPAIVIPAGFTADGLPVGVELLGRAWSEP